MWLRPTQHYKGHFPLDGGGIVFYGDGPKEVTPDEFGQRIAKMNFPYIVPCSREGQYLVDVPAITVERVIEVPAVPVVAPAPKSEAPEETGEVDQAEDSVQSAIEIVEAPKTLKKRK